jgi:hypothetical protein
MFTESDSSWVCGRVFNIKKSTCLSIQNKVYTTYISHTLDIMHEYNVSTIHVFYQIL